MKRARCAARLVALLTVFLFARFPAPPAGTSRITIQIPHVPDLTGVPVNGRQNGPGGA